MNYNDVLQKALDFGKSKYPKSNNYRHAAFANSVSYLITGMSGGYGGPSIREHCVSWALAGDGFNESAETNIGTITVQYPDGRLPRAGEWEFEKACEFAENICYGSLPQMATKIAKQEHCFDDDPADVVEVNLRNV